MNTKNNNKTLIGSLLFFLGIIGLVIGLLLYPYNTEERKTFIKGWLMTLVFLVVFVVISSLILTLSRS